MSWMTSYPPDARVAHTLCASWVARPDGPAAMLPDVSVSVAWGSDGRVRLYGPHTRGWIADAGADMMFVGVDIRPGRASFVRDVRELVDTTADLDALLPATRARRLGDAVERATTEADRLRIMQREVASLTGGRGDALVPAVVAALRRDARVPVADLAYDLGLSVRQLHRRCVRALGFGPATLRRVIRLERFLHLGCATEPRRPVAELAAVAGFADQQHLAHDCRELTGRTPAALLRCG